MTRETAPESNYDAIEKSVECCQSKVKSVQFAMNEWVLFKVQNFLGKNQKIFADAFKLPFVITRVFDNGTVQMRKKCGKHDLIVI
jgi:hypothetical protein